MRDSMQAENTFRVAIWTAVSTEKQAADDKVSLEVQLERCREAIRHKGWKEVAVLQVPGHTRSITFLEEARAQIPQMDELIQLAVNDQIDLVICYSFDRLARTMALLTQLKDYLASCGTQIYSITQPYEPVHPDALGDGQMASDAITAFAGLMAQSEIRTFVNRSRGGKNGKSQDGHYLAPMRPFGYRRVATGVLEKDPEEAAILRMAYEWYMKGDSFRTVAKRLDGMGVRGPRGGKIDSTRIRRILSNPLLMGRITWGKTRIANVVNRDTGSLEKVAKPSVPIISDGTHEPIFTEREYYDFLAERDRRSGRGRGSQTTGRVYLLSGLLRCGFCGSPMHITRVTALSQNRGDPFAGRAYLCSKYREYGTCEFQVARVLVVERMVEDWLEKWLHEPEVFEEALLEAGAASRADAQLEEVERALRELEIQRSRWDAAYGSGVLGLAAYADRVRECEAKSQELLQRKEYLEARAGAGERREQLLNTLRASFEAGGLLKGLTRPETKTLYRRVFDEITWQDGQIVDVKLRLS